MDMPAPGRREANRRATEERIEAALTDIYADDPNGVSHDALAERTGIARRTIYRYYPDRQSLMDALWRRVTVIAGPQVRMPESEDDLLATIGPIYRGFDTIAPLLVVTRSTPHGRQMRLSQKARRQETYTAALADAVSGLSPEDRRLATAVIQLLHTTAWLEMRDHWDMTGDEIAASCDWAIRTLLADLRRRDGRPLADSPA